MVEAAGHEEAAEGKTYQLRLVQALDRDPMVETACYLFSVESALTGFEIEVRVAPICYHLALQQQRSDMVGVAHDLVCQLLDTEVDPAHVVHVGSDGAARTDGKVFARVFPLL